MLKSHHCLIVIPEARKNKLTELRIASWLFCISDTNTIRKMYKIDFGRLDKKTSGSIPYTTRKEFVYMNNQPVDSDFVRSFWSKPLEHEIVQKNRHKPCLIRIVHQEPTSTSNWDKPSRPKKVGHNYWKTEKGLSSRHWQKCHQITQKEGELHPDCFQIKKVKIRRDIR